MNLDEAYCVQEGCWCCYTLFVMVEYDCDDHYYCTRNAPPRPPCGSVCMDEYVNPYDDETGEATMTLDEAEKRSMAAWEAWGGWKEDREVTREGTCRYYKKAHGMQPCRRAKNVKDI